jgi:hypothetical protein
MHRLTRSVVFSLLFAVVAVPALAYDLAALKAESAKVVPSGAQMLTSGADAESAFVAYQAGERSYQFTVAGDTDPQAMDATGFTLQGRKAFFFSPMPGSGVAMVLLDSETSLAVLYSLGFSADKDVTEQDMKDLVDRMDLDALR